MQDNEWFRKEGWLHWICVDLSFDENRRRLCNVLNLLSAASYFQTIGQHVLCVIFFQTTTFVFFVIPGHTDDEFRRDFFEQLSSLYNHGPFYAALKF